MTIRIERRKEGLLNHSKHYDLDKIKTPTELRQMLGVSDSEIMCDGFAHHISCSNLIQEIKPLSKIPEAVRQLESTYYLLKNKNIIVNFIFLIVYGPHKLPTNAYKIDFPPLNRYKRRGRKKNTMALKILYYNKKPVMIDNKYIYVVRKDRITDNNTSQKIKYMMTFLS